VEANLVAAKTYRWLIMLSISGGLLAVLVLFIIIRYVRKAYAYQVALENSKEEAEKLARTKELFMANMSHEIRTPVTAISGFTEQLLHEPSDENTSRSLRIIKSSSDHLLKIIDDILDFLNCRITSYPEKVHFSISRTLGCMPCLRDRQYRITPISLFNKSGTLMSSLRSLQAETDHNQSVSNSVKFTKNGTVHFTAGSVRKAEGEIDLIMEFTDTGIGIDESKLDSIFEDFTQAEMSTTRKFGGTGLGLSIVKKLVELHNGTIELTSKKNQGTKIICRMPYLTGDEKQIRKEIAPPLPVPEEITGLKILVVDDEEYNRLLFRKILNRWNVECHEVVNGMDALEILKEDRFYILFMDMRMPGIDGFRTTQFIRNEMKISDQDMPIIFISGRLRLMMSGKSTERQG
jgi:CheY-like chemotaxis protein